jgi:hypothetical protein
MHFRGGHRPELGPPARSCAGEIRPRGWPPCVTLRETSGGLARLRRLVVELAPGVQLPPAGLQLALEISGVDDPLYLTLVGTAAAAGASAGTDVPSK